MQPEDIKRIEEIWYNESVHVHNWMDNPKKFWDNRRKDFTDETCTASEKFVYEESEIIIGFITVRDNYILEIFRDYEHRKDPNGRSKRIGTCLLNHVKECRHFLTASVYMLNHKAVKFYINSDFVIKNLYTEDTGFCKFWMEWKREKP